MSSGSILTFGGSETPVSKCSRWGRMHRPQELHKCSLPLPKSTILRSRLQATPTAVTLLADGGDDRSNSCSKASASGLDASIESDDSVARIPLNLPRRSLQVTFTCKKCEARTERLVNPAAWEKGTVFAQCSGCNVWHKLRDEAGLIQEIRYVVEEQ